MYIVEVTQSIELIRTEEFWETVWDAASLSLGINSFLEEY